MDGFPSLSPAEERVWSAGPLGTSDKSGKHAKKADDVDDQMSQRALYCQVRRPPTVSS